MSDRVTQLRDLQDQLNFVIDAICQLEGKKPSREHEAAQELLDWLKEKDWREFDLRSVAKSGPRSTRKVKPAAAALAKLCEKKWLTLEGNTYKLQENGLPL